MLGRMNHFPQQSLNGVSRRKVNRLATREEEAGSWADVAVTAPSIPSGTSHGHTCLPGSPAQQMYLQEPGAWKEAQEQLLRYQLAGRDQLLLLCPDLRQERQQFQEQSRLAKESGSLGLSQEKRASYGAAEALCLHSMHPETTQEQL